MNDDIGYETDDEQALLRSRLGLDEDEICPTVDCFEYAQRVMPRRGYYEIEDGVIGVYDRKGEIVTAIPTDFDPRRRIPCEACRERTTPMELRCGSCSEKIDPAWVWSCWYSDSTGEGGEGGDDSRPSSSVRLVSFRDRSDAIEVARTLRDAGVASELVDETDADGRGIVAIWIDEIDLGSAQNAIARPGVEG